VWALAVLAPTPGSPFSESSWSRARTSRCRSGASPRLPGDEGPRRRVDRRHRGNHPLPARGERLGKSSLIKILAASTRPIQADCHHWRRHDRRRPDLPRVGPIVRPALRARTWRSSTGFRWRDLATVGGFPVKPGDKAVRWRALRRHARAVLDRFDVDVDPRAWSASSARPEDDVAIARALQTSPTPRKGS